MNGDNIIYISAGMTCAVTLKLKDLKLRKYAFPFDWQITSMKSFYECVVNDFDGLLDEIWIGDRIKRLLIVDSVDDVTQLDEMIYPVICKKYNILFPHYFHEVDKKSIDDVRLKMKRRIESFNDALKSQSKVRFVHNRWPLYDWQREQYE